MSQIGCLIDDHQYALTINQLIGLHLDFTARSLQA